MVLLIQDGGGIRGENIFCVCFQSLRKFSNGMGVHLMAKKMFELMASRVGRDVITSNTHYRINISFHFTWKLQNNHQGLLL